MSRAGGKYVPIVFVAELLKDGGALDGLPERSVIGVNRSFAQDQLDVPARRSRVAYEISPAMTANDFSCGLLSRQEAVASSSLLGPPRSWREARTMTHTSSQLSPEAAEWMKESQ
jgi:hypothetical protein